MAEQVKPDTFDPPCHKLKTNIQSKLDALLKEYESQFAKDETYIRTMTLNQYDDWHGKFWPCIPEALSYHYEEIINGWKKK